MNLKLYRSARMAGTPIMAIQTPDPTASVTEIVSNTNADVPLIKWDIVEGMVGVNESGLAAVAHVLGGQSAESMRNPVTCLMTALKLPPKSVLFLLNLQRFMRDESTNTSQVVQSLWNLRDRFKSDLRTAVLVGPSFTFPAELRQDIFIIDEPLPSPEELRTLVTEIQNGAIHDGVLQSELGESVIEKAVNALQGLAIFPAETILTMSISDKGLDQAGLQERKRQMIESVRGMSVWPGGEKFSALGGLEQAKDFFTQYINGRVPVRVVAFIDEIEKAMAGAAHGNVQGDSSGVAGGQHGTILTQMQDNGWTGSIFYGHPGSGKTALAKAIGNEAEVPTIYFDIGGMKAMYVGQTEQFTRDGFKMLKAIGGDRVLFIATCNNIRVLSPELRRRFGLPTFFFDLPTKTEQVKIWEIYLKKYGFWDGKFKGLNNDWSGAEIERCCSLAWDLKTTPDQTAKYIVPIAESDPEELSDRRQYANRRFLSASYPGKYSSTQPSVGQTTKPTRRLNPQNN